MSPSRMTFTMAPVSCGSLCFPGACRRAGDRRIRELLIASVVGYEVGIRVRDYLGERHYKMFHTTGTARSLAAAAAVGRLLRLPRANVERAWLLGTQAAGLWEFLATQAIPSLCTPPTPWPPGSPPPISPPGLHRRERILTAIKRWRRHVEKRRSSAPDGSARRGWTLAETSFKFHASCRLPIGAQTVCCR